MTPESLSTLANVAEVIGAGTIVTGAVFGLVQLRQRISRDYIASSATPRK